MPKTKNKPNLVILIDGLNNNKLNVFEQEANDFIKLVNTNAGKKNSMVVYNGLHHTGFAKPRFLAAEPEVSFYDIITGDLKKFLPLIKKSKTVINIIHNTDDIIDFENKELLIKILPQLEKAQINFFTNNAENQIKSLDFKVLAQVYSKTSAGIQTLFSHMTSRTLNFLKGKN